MSKPADDSRIIPVADDYFEFGILQNTSNGRLLNDFLNKKRQRGKGKRQKLFQVSHESDDEEYGNFDIIIKRKNTNVPPSSIQQSEMPPPELPSTSRQLQASKHPAKTVTSSQVDRMRRTTPAAAVVETPPGNSNASMLVSTIISQHQAEHMFDTTIYSPIKRSAPTKSPSARPSIGKASTQSNESQTFRKKHLTVKKIVRGFVPTLNGIEPLSRAPVKYRNSSHLELPEYADDEAESLSEIECVIHDSQEDEKIEEEVVVVVGSNRRMSAANVAQVEEGVFARSHHSEGGSKRSILESDNENQESAPINRSAPEMHILQNQQNSRFPQQTPRSHRKSPESVQRSISKKNGSHRATTGFHRRLFSEENDEVTNLSKDKPEQIELTQLSAQATTSNRSSVSQKRTSIHERVDDQCNPDIIHNSLARKLNKPMPMSKRKSIIDMITANNSRKVQSSENNSRVNILADGQPAVEPTDIQVQHCRTLAEIEAEINAIYTRTLAPETQESPLKGLSPRFTQSISQQVMASPMSDGSINLDKACENMRRTLFSQSSASESQQSQSKEGEDFLEPSQPVTKKVLKAKNPLLESVLATQQLLHTTRTLPKNSVAKRNSSRRTLYPNQIDGAQPSARKSLTELTNKPRMTAEPSKINKAQMQKTNKSSDEATPTFVPSPQAQTSKTAQILSSKEKKTGEFQSNTVPNAKPKARSQDKGKQKKSTADADDDHEAQTSNAGQKSPRKETITAEVQSDEMSTEEASAKTKQKKAKGKRTNSILDSDEAAQRSPRKKSRTAEPQNAAGKSTKGKRKKQASEEGGPRRSSRKTTPVVAHYILGNPLIEYRDWKDIFRDERNKKKKQIKEKAKKEKLKIEQMKKRPISGTVDAAAEKSSTDGNNSQPSTSSARPGLGPNRRRAKIMKKPLQSGTSDSDAPAQLETGQMLEMPVAQENITQIAQQLSQVTNANTIQDIINESQNASRIVTTTTQNTRSGKLRQAKQQMTDPSAESDSGVDSVITSPSNWMRLLMDFDSLNEKAMSVAVAENEYFTISGLENLQFMKKGGYDICKYLSDTSTEQYGYLRFRPHGEKSASKSQHNETRFLVLSGEIKLFVPEYGEIMNKEGSFISVKSGQKYALINTDEPTVLFFIKTQVS